MKHIAVWSALFIAAVAPGHAADTPAPAAAEAKPAAPDLRAQLEPIVAKIRSKLDAGEQSEGAVADELKAYDAVLAAHKGDTTGQVAEALFIEANLYARVFENYDRATALCQQIKDQYPRSEAAMAASEMLDRLDQQKESHAIQASLKPGVAFPTFTAPGLDGKKVSLADYRGKVVLVDFWATWCPPCVAELPNVVAAYQKYHDKGFEIVGISLDEHEDKLKSFIETKHMTWAQSYDGKGWESGLVQKYGVDSIPATYLLDRDGKIVAKNLRGTSLDRELERLLK